MEVSMWIHCNNCHRDGKVRIKLGTSVKDLEENYPCPNCGSVGKLIHTNR